MERVDNFEYVHVLLYQLYLLSHPSSELTQTVSKDWAFCLQYLHVDQGVYINVLVCIGGSV